MVKKGYSVQDHIKVFETILKRKRLLKTKHSHNSIRDRIKAQKTT